MRKLSESNDVQLTELPLKLEGTSARLPQKSVWQESQRNNSLVYSPADKENVSRKHSTPTIDSSPIGFTLRHLEDAKRVAGIQQVTPTEVRLIDSLDITIYLADGQGYKFSLIGGKLATASSLLRLMADHLEIDADILIEVCSLWMMSELLEVQLKPHHVPYDIRKNWVYFLKKFTPCESEKLVDDEPLLLENEYTSESLTEILYATANHGILNGRYPCDVDLSIKLAALQMSVELEPEDSQIDWLGIELDQFFPPKHRRNVKTLYVFGIPIAGCKGSEAKMNDEYQEAMINYPNKHSRRIAYLKLVRNLPFYGSAFFRGQVERPYIVSLRDFKRMLLAATSPGIQVLIGINRDYITVIDETKQESLLMQPLSKCSWRVISLTDQSSASLNENDQSCLLLHFPDNYFNSDCVHSVGRKSLQVARTTKLLQIFSNQAVMMQALMKSLRVLCTLHGFEKNPVGQVSGVTSKFTTTSFMKSLDDIELIDENPPNSQSNGNAKAEVVGKDEKRASDEPRYPILKCHEANITYKEVDEKTWYYINSFKKLCLATFDSTGQCLDAQGSLRILQQTE